MSVVLGDALVRVRPDTSTFASDLKRDTHGPSGKAGQDAGLGYAQGFDSKASSRMSGMFKKIALAGAAVLTGVAVKKGIDFVKESTAGYRDHLKVVALTNQVIKTTAGAANISAREIGKLADQIERKTGVDGDAIQSGANLLATFTNVQNKTGAGNKIFSRATQTITDMSVALGQDTKGSAIQLGKALNDPIKGVSALSRVGVSFTEQQKKQIKTLVESGNVLGAQKVILKELGKEFGGAAAAAASPADKAKASYRQLQDQVGSVTVPVMNKLYTIFSAKIAPILLTLADKYLPKVRRALLSALDHVDVSNLMNGLSSIGKIDLAGAGNGLSKIGDSIKGIDWAALKDAFGQGVSDSISVFGVVIGFAADHVDTLAKYLPLLVVGFIAYKAAQAASNVVALAHLPITAANAAAMFLLASSNRRLAAQMAITNGVENVGLLTRVRGTIATIASTTASLAAGAAAKVFAAGQWLVNAALTANPIGIVVVAIAALVAGLIYAYKHSETFRNVVDGALKAVGKAFVWLYNGVVRPVVVFILRAFAKVIGGFAAIARAGGKLPGPLGAGFRKIAGSLQSLADRANHAADGVKKIPTKHDTRITVSGNAAASIAGLAGQIQHLDKNVTVRVAIQAAVHAAVVGGGRLPARAAGGDVVANRAYLVGEQGPEIASFGSSGRITSNRRTRQLLAPGGPTLATSRTGSTGSGNHGDLIAALVAFLNGTFDLTIDGEKVATVFDRKADGRISAHRRFDTGLGRLAT